MVVRERTPIVLPQVAARVRQRVRRRVRLRPLVRAVAMLLAASLILGVFLFYGDYLGRGRRIGELRSDVRTWQAIAWEKQRRCVAVSNELQRELRSRLEAAYALGRNPEVLDLTDVRILASRLRQAC
jgi:hypothetical protein